MMMPVTLYLKNVGLEHQGDPLPTANRVLPQGFLCICLSRLRSVQADDEVHKQTFR